jgi:hypothetical protein
MFRDVLVRACLKSHARRGHYRPAAAAEAPATPQRLAVPREYLSLHKYLDNRFVDKVVLTFAQVEDLLGFALPDFARRDPGWWANTGANNAPSAQASSWTHANRIAMPNLLAQTVAFDRARS